MYILPLKSTPTAASAAPQSVHHLRSSSFCFFSLVVKDLGLGFKPTVILPGAYSVALPISVASFSHAGGWHHVMATVDPAKLSLIRPSDDPNMPWTGLLIGAPLLGIYYWCTNQVMVQRVLIFVSCLAGAFVVASRERDNAPSALRPPARYAHAGHAQGALRRMDERATLRA